MIEIEVIPHKFEFYSKRNWKLQKIWRWRIRADNGNIIADSSEGYRNFVDCEYNAMSTSVSIDNYFMNKNKLDSIIYKPKDYSNE